MPAVILSVSFFQRPGELTWITLIAFTGFSMNFIPLPLCLTFVEQCILRILSIKDNFFSDFLPACLHCSVKFSFFNYFRNTNKQTLFYVQNTHLRRT